MASCVSTWAHPPAASPIACCNTAPSEVFAIDVGHNQIDWRLRNDPRVEVREGVNARYLQPDDFPYSFDLAVIDVSFISVIKILPAVLPLLRVPRFVGRVDKTSIRSGPR